MTNKQKFYQRINEEGFKHPLKKHEWVWSYNDGDGMVSVSIVDEKVEDEVCFDLIYKCGKTPKGSASEVLKLICEIADSTKVSMNLRVLPSKQFTDSKSVMSKSQLTKWYGRNGFVSTSENKMVRVWSAGSAG